MGDRCYSTLVVYAQQDEDRLERGWLLRSLKVVPRSERQQAEIKECPVPS